MEKESLEAKDDEKKTPSKPKELEPVSSKTKGPTVSACLSEILAIRIPVKQKKDKNIKKMINEER